MYPWHRHLRHVDGRNDAGRQFVQRPEAAPGAARLRGDHHRRWLRRPPHRGPDGHAPPAVRVLLPSFRPSLGRPAGAVGTSSSGHRYSFACVGHDQFRLRMGWPDIDKRHDNPLIFSLASSAPQAGGQSWKYSYSAHHRQVTYHSPEPGWSSTSLPGSNSIAAGPAGCML